MSTSRFTVTNRAAAAQQRHHHHNTSLNDTSGFAPIGQPPMMSQAAELAPRTSFFGDSMNNTAPLQGESPLPGLPHRSDPEARRGPAPNPSAATAAPKPDRISSASGSEHPIKKHLGEPTTVEDQLKNLFHHYCASTHSKETQHGHHHELTFTALLRMLDDCNVYKDIHQPGVLDVIKSIQPPPGKHITWRDFQIVLDLVAVHKFPELEEHDVAVAALVDWVLEHFSVQSADDSGAPSPSIRRQNHPHPTSVSEEDGDTSLLIMEDQQQAAVQREQFDDDDDEDATFQQFQNKYRAPSEAIQATSPPGKQKHNERAGTVGASTSTPSSPSTSPPRNKRDKSQQPMQYLPMGIDQTARLMGQLVLTAAMGGQHDSASSHEAEALKLLGEYSSDRQQQPAKTVKGKISRLSAQLCEVAQFPTRTCAPIWTAFFVKLLGERRLEASTNITKEGKDLNKEEDDDEFTVMIPSRFTTTAARRPDQRVADPQEQQEVEFGLLETNPLHIPIVTWETVCQCAPFVFPSSTPMGAEELCFSKLMMALEGSGIIAALGAARNE